MATSPVFTLDCAFFERIANLEDKCEALESALHNLQQSSTVKTAEITELTQKVTELTSKLDEQDEKIRELTSGPPGTGLRSAEMPRASEETSDRPRRPPATTSSLEADVSSAPDKPTCKQHTECNCGKISGQLLEILQLQAETQATLASVSLKRPQENAKIRDDYSQSESCSSSSAEPHYKRQKRK